MPPNESTEAAFSRRDVLILVGFAGGASRAFATVGAGAPDRCELNWDAGTCVVTTETTRIAGTAEGEGRAFEAFALADFAIATERGDGFPVKPA